MANSRPKKRFSQNFLTDTNIARKIVGLLDIAESDTVFEIGPGRGMLTELVAKSGARLIAVEIDRTLIDDLKNKLGGYDNVTIVTADFLTVNPSDFVVGRFKLIGNIPYDITSPLLDWIVRYRNSLDRVVITMQKELAERIASGAGGKDWAPISIFTQLYYNLTKAMTIAPQAFYPKPKIYSTTLVLDPAERYAIADHVFFEKVVRSAFSQRRKRLVNNLAGVLDIDKENLESVLTTLGWDVNIRAEQIDIAGFIRLADSLASTNIS